MELLIFETPKFEGLGDFERRGDLEDASHILLAVALLSRITTKTARAPTIKPPMAPPTAAPISGPPKPALDLETALELLD
jgi:hypothetical protein